MEEPSSAPKEGQRGTLGFHAPWWRGSPGGRAEWPPGIRGHPLALFVLYLLHLLKPTKTEPFFVISPLFCRRRDSKIEVARSSCPGTLPEGGLTSGASPPP